MSKNKQIHMFDKVFAILILEAIFLILPFLIFWWSCYLFKRDIFIGMIISLFISIILNILLIKKVIGNFYNLRKIWLMLIHLFFSICIFVFFMGVPVFNVILGIISGIYVGKKAHINNESKETFEKNLKFANIYSLITLVFICICSAFLALSDPYTASNLKGMFNLSFSITTSMLWIIIILGAIILILGQYFMATIIAKKVYNTKINRK